MLNPWTENCSELYTHRSRGDPKVVTVPQPTDTAKDELRENDLVVHFREISKNSLFIARQSRLSSSLSDRLMGSNPCQGPCTFQA
ncbi:hypothetical protein PoB_001845300 [Plakobranchus ocellatus]|uniref:Uncharacterized protein n=1 Tax=Plakobranchus ocellatus TaxID=259542 RepID=A0AAV3ZBI1_9GAST|nr:hypothetical protein PoB_001845300 [Plakobranchus ocellatus]